MTVPSDQMLFKTDYITSVNIPLAKISNLVDPIDEDLYIPSPTVREHLVCYMKMVYILEYLDQ